jgi:RHS repeat-associated protein
VNRRIAAAVFVLTALYAHSVAAAERFRPIHRDDIAYGHYLVTLAADVEEADVAWLAGELAKTYGGRLEAYAATGFHGFAIVMRPAAARLLSSDARVVLVEEQPAGEQAPKQAASPPSVVRVPASGSPAAASPPASPIPFRAASESSATEPWSGTYVYDGSGNIKAIGSNHYRYDGVGRLVGATAITSAQSWTQSFRYDAFGNLITTSVNDGVTPVVAAAVDSSTNRNDQASNCPQGATCVTGTFDEAGNQTTSGAATYGWDSLSMMSDLQAPGRHDLYVYDVDDQRVATINYTDASTQVWHYTLRDLDGKVVRQLSASVAGGTATFKWERDYVYRGQNLLAVDTNAIRLHFHLDHLGTPRLITDDAGGKRALHTYWPYGLEAAGSDHDSELMKFTGNERDSDDPSDAAALDYMHARYYAPVTGRFLSLDRGHPRPLLPQSWNRFAYTADNPLLRFDPNGESWDEFWEKVSSASEHYSRSFDFRLVLSFEGKFGNVELKASPVEQNIKLEVNAGPTEALRAHGEMVLIGKDGLWPGDHAEFKLGTQSKAGPLEITTIPMEGTHVELNGKIPIFPEAEGGGAAAEAAEGGGAGLAFEPALDVNEYGEYLRDTLDAAGLGVDATLESIDAEAREMEKATEEFMNYIVDVLINGIPVQ